MNIHVPEVDFAGIISTVDHKSLELLIDHVDHCRKRELLWKRRLGQSTVLIGEDLYHTLVLLVCENLKLIVVVILKNVPTHKERRSYTCLVTLIS